MIIEQIKSNKRSAAIVTPLPMTQGGLKIILGKRLDAAYVDPFGEARAELQSEGSIDMTALHRIRTIPSFAELCKFVAFDED